MIAALLVGALAISCGEGRFPVCKSDAECAARETEPAGKLCYNLKCVECRYDSDCPLGKACNRKLNTCQSLGGEPVSDDTSDASVSWDPNTWDECAKRCKDQDCIQGCDQRFRK